MWQRILVSICMIGLLCTTGCITTAGKTSSEDRVQTIMNKIYGKMDEPTPKVKYDKYLDTSSIELKIYPVISSLKKHCSSEIGNPTSWIGKNPSGINANPVFSSQ